MDHRDIQLEIISARIAAFDGNVKSAIRVLSDAFDLAGEMPDWEFGSLSADIWNAAHGITSKLYEGSMLHRSGAGLLEKVQSASQKRGMSLVFPAV